MKLFLFILFLPVFLLSCNKENDIEIVSYVPKIIVEGSIEKGDYASVLLSVSASMTGPKDTLSLLNNVIRSAKVTVWDDSTTETLVLQTNKNRLPPFEYRGSVLIGKEGKQYWLKIEYDGKEITSKTYIPPAVPLSKISFKRDNPTDTTGYIHIDFKNTTDYYYQVATRVVSSEKVFTPCLYGNIDKNVYPKDKSVSIQINKGPMLFPKVSYTTYFNAKSSILIKFSTFQKSGYKFWTSYQNEILNAQNPIFPANTSLNSNIDGGIGIWCGYGSNVYEVRLQDIGK